MAIDTQIMFLHRNLRIGINRDARFIAAIMAAVAVGFVAYVARLSDVTHDAFHEMALVREYFRTGEFPHNDVFAFTPTVSPAVHHEWGTGLFLYLVAGANPLGYHGMAIARLLLIAMLGLLLYRVARNQGAHPIVIGLCAPIVFPIAWVGFATLRAQMFTLVFLACQILLQQSDWRGKKTWIVGWFFLYVAWLNVHAGFVVGIGLLGFHVLERWIEFFFARSPSSGLSEFFVRFWHHLLLVPCALVGLIINPWGMDYPKYLWHAIRMPRPTMIEWQPLWMTPDALTTMLAYSVMVLGLGYCAKNRQWKRLRGWLFTCIASYVALKHIRHGSLFAVAWLAYMPGWLTPTPLGRSFIAWIYEYRTTAMRLCIIIVGSCSVYALGHSVWKARIPDDDPQGVMVYPVGAVKYLQEEGFRGNLMTPFTAGAYVSWTCYPNIRISLDGRYEVAYRDDVLPKHDDFYLARDNWKEVLNEYNADAILVQQAAPVRRFLGTKVHETDNYSLVYEDKVYALFVLDSLSVRSSEAIGSSQRR
jgi:hypothetical protein